MTLNLFPFSLVFCMKCEGLLSLWGLTDLSWIAIGWSPSLVGTHKLTLIVDWSPSLEGTH